MSFLSSLLRVNIPLLTPDLLHTPKANHALPASICFILTIAFSFRGWVFWLEGLCLEGTKKTLPMPQAHLGNPSFLSQSSFPVYLELFINSKQNNQFFFLSLGVICIFRFIVDHKGVLFNIFYKWFVVTLMSVI